MSFSFRQFLLVALAAILYAAPADAGLCVDVDLHFDGTAPEPATVTTLEQEAAAIWAPYGVDLHWASPACAIEDLSFDVLVDYHLPRLPLNSVLGSTHVQLTCTDHVPIVVDAGATEAVLASMTSDELLGAAHRPHLGARELGRAFGRVVAHEIGHVILGMPNHQPQGLMRRAFQPADMVSPVRLPYGLSPLEIARLRHRSEAIVTRREGGGPADPEVAAVQCLHQRRTLGKPEQPSANR